jgi:hypothetical protein
VTTAPAPARPRAAARPGAALAALAARETRRFAVNPLFLLAVVMTAWTTWDDRNAPADAVGTGTGTRGSSWAGSA